MRLLLYHRFFLLALNHLNSYTSVENGLEALTKDVHSDEFHVNTQFRVIDR